MTRITRIAPVTRETSVVSVLKKAGRPVRLAELHQLLLNRRKSLGIPFHGRTPNATIRRILQEAAGAQRIAPGMWRHIDAWRSPRSK